MVEASQKTKDLVLAAGALRLAQESAIKATRLAEDRHNAFYNLASVCAILNDPAGVEHNLRQAMAEAPNWFKPHWSLAQFLLLAGRREEAEAEAQLAADLNAGKNEEVKRTLEQVRASLKK